MYLIRSNPVGRPRHQIQFYTLPSVMPDFMVFRRNSNTAPGLMPTRLGSRYMDDGTWYMDIALSVGITPSC